MRPCEGSSHRRHRAWLFKSLQAFKQCRQRHSRIFELTFPYCENTPSVAVQFLHCLAIPINVGLQFFCPEIDTCLGQDCILAVCMAMPKTSVHENADFQSRQDNIRFSRQVSAMKSEAVTLGMQKAPHSQLRFGVLSPDTGHHSRSCGAVNYIHFVFSQNSVVS